MGKAEVQKISKQSNIARQDIYRIIPTLEELGLVEEIVATPKQYTAIPLNEGTLSLYQKKIDEDSRLKNSIQSLVKQSYKPDRNAGKDSKSDFIITAYHKRVNMNLQKAYSEASSIDIVLSGGNAIDFLASCLYDSLLTAISKGAKIRTISKKTELHSATKKRLENLSKNANFKIKFVDSEFDFCMAIVNKEEMNISISEKAVPSLWTNNYQIVSMSQLMFENLWNSN